MSVPAFTVLPSETVLWTGRPSAFALAREVFLVDWVVVYFSIIAVWTLLRQPNGAEDASLFPYVASLFVLCAVAVLLLIGTAFLVTRVSGYYITDRRIVFAVGLVRAVTVSIPLNRISHADIAHASFGTTTFVFRTEPDLAYSRFQLWPHVLRYDRAVYQPAMRCLKPDMQLISRLKYVGIACWDKHAPGKGLLFGGVRTKL
ncbi:MAG: photosynthetic complex putative assembly protein PuhB [Pseudomonadota bacterium]